MIVGVRFVVGVVLSQATAASFHPGPWSPPPSHDWTGPFVRWDSSIFIGIAQHGYTATSTYAFLPLYPLLIRAVSPIFGYQGGALAVAWTASLFAVWGVMDVTGRFTTRQLAWVAGALLVWNPVSIFLMAGYAEALLVALMIWSLRFCLDGRWWLAAATAAAASAVQPQGLASAVVVAVGILLADRSVRGAIRGAAFGVIGALGFIAYLAYCWHTTGNPFIIRSAEAVGWGAHLTYPLHMVVEDLSRSTSWHWVQNGVDTSRQMRVVYAMDAIVGIVVTVISVVGIVLAYRDRRLVLPALLLVVGLLISVTSVGQYADSTARYVLYLAPFYVLVAVGLSRLPERARIPTAIQVLLVSAAFAAFFGVVFNLGYWLPG